MITRVAPASGEQSEVLIGKYIWRYMKAGLMTEMFINRNFGGGMKRREFVAGAGMLIGVGCTPVISAADEAVAVKQAVVDVYAAFSGFDKKKYRALLTEDYLLLENGELLDIEGDVAMMASPDSGHKRTDSFDFRSVKVQGDFSYLVYFLKSQIKDNKGTRDREWLESAILRRSASGWRMALLHSTRIVKPEG